MDWLSMLSTSSGFYLICVLFFSLGSDATGSVLIKKLLQPVSESHSNQNNEGLDTVPSYNTDRMQSLTMGVRLFSKSNAFINDRNIRWKRSDPADGVSVSSPLEDDDTSSAQTSQATVAEGSETTQHQQRVSSERLSTQDPASKRSSQANEMTSLRIVTTNLVSDQSISTVTKVLDVSTTGAGVTGDNYAGKSTTSCNGKQLDATLTNFGNYGLIAFAGALGLAAMLLFILFLFVCLPRYVKRKPGKKKKIKIQIENISDMRSPAVVYRPRPSLAKTTNCVPTPLAMVMNEEPTLTSISRIKVLTTDLDDTLDPLAAPEEYPDNRKMSNMSIDPTNVSTFLLRQNSVQQQ